MAKTHRRQADRLADPPPGQQRATLIGLGLNKMHKTRELQDTPSIRGMVAHPAPRHNRGGARLSAPTLPRRARPAADCPHHLPWSGRPGATRPHPAKETAS